MIILIALACYGVSFLLITLLNYLLMSYDIDEDMFWDGIDENLDKWLLCPFVSPLIYMWIIWRLINGQES